MNVNNKHILCSNIFYHCWRFELEVKKIDGGLKYLEARWSVWTLPKKAKFEKFGKLLIAQNCNFYLFIKLLATHQKMSGF